MIKAITAAVLTVVALAGVSLLALRDMDRRPDYCAMCHAPQQGVQTWVSSDYLAHTHALAAVSCQQCHERTVGVMLGEIVSQVRNDYQMPANMDYDSEDCLRCHDDRAQLVELTASLSRNPHDSPHGDWQCSACHKAHGASVDVCGGCHGRTIVGPAWVSPQQAVALAQSQ